MATSFLQYCATCETQIFTPRNSILYCSDACRRKDSCKPLSLSADAMPRAISPPDSTSSSPRPILPSRVPTGASYESTASVSNQPPDLHSDKSDLDPTEWKPKVDPTEWKPRGPRRGFTTNSEARRYLSLFHTKGDETASEPGQSPPIRKPHQSTTSIVSLNMTSTPSLIHTPTSTSSSPSRNAECNSLPYNFSTRPLPPLRNPSYSSSAGATKGLDLVMPHVAPPTDGAGSAPENVPFHGGVWEQQTVRGLPKGSTSDVKKEGLGALFGAGEKSGEK